MQPLVFMVLVVCQLLAAGYLLVWAAKHQMSKWRITAGTIGVIMVITAWLPPAVITFLIFR